jgi:Fur family peroxide stress response transcriptional regulator
MKTKLRIDKERRRSREGAPERQEMKRPWGELRRLLAARGDRLTPQRMAIYDAVVGRSTHPSVDMVYDQVHRRFPSLSRATVYVTLSLFADLGLIQEVSGPIRRYDGQAARHVNLVCERCGSVVDVFDTRLEDIERKVASRARFSVRKTRFELHGICPNCQRSA